MKSASYAVVRYVPDPGRNEALNVGIVVWDEEEYRVKVDSRAAERIIKQSPWLERDALMYLEPWLHERIGPTESFRPERAAAMIEGQSGFPVWFTEPRHTSIDESHAQGIDDALDRLVTRIVRPRRPGGGSSLDLADELEKRINRWISRNAVARHHVYHGSRTGVRRTVDFYANSGKNVAVDFLKLNLKRAEEIRRRADAEAYKVLDRDHETIARYIVLCEFSKDRELERTNQTARTIMEAEGAEIFTDVEAAALALSPG